MRRSSIWPTLVILLVGVIVLREPRWARLEENFLRWLLHNAPPRVATVPLTIVEIGIDPAVAAAAATGSTPAPEFVHGHTTTISPLEYALFLQAALPFQPTVVAFENVLQWRDRDKDQEQVFLDQAMRVPKLLLGAELTVTPDPDAPAQEVPIFTQVTGSRRALVEFPGIGRQPNEDLRLVSTPGFTNLPTEVVDDLHVPLLFRYRGEVVPSFALQAIMLWRRVTLAEVKIDLGSHILLPKAPPIPIRSDGTLLINSNAAQGGVRVSLNALLLAAQQKAHGTPGDAAVKDLREQVLLARAPLNPHSPPDIFAATIATIESNHYVRRVSRIFDYILLVLATVLAGLSHRLSRASVILGTIAFCAVYGLIALALLSRFLLWLPGFFPLALALLLILIYLLAPGERPGEPALPNE